MRTYWIHFCSIVITAALWFALPLTAAAQEKDADQYILRTYDVGDLVMDIRDRPYNGSAETTPSVRGGGFGGGGGGFGGGGGGGGGQFSVPDIDQPQQTYLPQFGGGGGGFGSGGGFVPPQQSMTGSGQMMDNLIDMIVGAVDPDTWVENGGSEGEVRPFGNSLVVWQTDAVHRQIAELLGQFRKNAGARRTLSIDARWLLLNSDELDKLMPPGEDGPQINRDRLAEFTRRATSIRGITHCFSGQLVYLVSGTRQNSVSSWIPVVGSAEAPDDGVRLVSQPTGSKFRFAAETSSNANAVGYQPIIESHNFGALLEIRPTVLQGSGEAMVDLQSTITVPGKRMDGQVQSPVLEQSAPDVDRIAIERQQLATTLTVPLGRPVLVGGMTYSPPAMNPGEGDSRAAGQAAAGENPQLYLILELR